MKTYEGWVQNRVQNHIRPVGNFTIQISYNLKMIVLVLVVILVAVVDIIKISIYEYLFIVSMRNQPYQVLNGVAGVLKQHLF